jgi:hypothetical protein
MQVRSYIVFNTNPRALSFQRILAVLIGTARTGSSECSVLAPLRGPRSLKPYDSKTGLPYGSGSSSVQNIRSRHPSYFLEDTFTLSTLLMFGL